jgi:hypothetical protein
MLNKNDYIFYVKLKKPIKTKEMEQQNDLYSDTCKLLFFLSKLIFSRHESNQIYYFLALPSLT